MLVVIVTGGRHFGEVQPWLSPAGKEQRRPVATAEARSLAAALDALHAKHGEVEVHQGECPTGADKWARIWCRRRFQRCRGWWAAWNQHGDAAGPMRNTEMVRGAQAGVCIVAPGNRGTADCAKKARAAGMQIIEIKPVSKAVDP